MRAGDETIVADGAVTWRVDNAFVDLWRTWRLGLRELSASSLAVLVKQGPVRTVWRVSADVTRTNGIGFTC